jgi:hypothetical protein
MKQLSGSSILLGIFLSFCHPVPGQTVVSRDACLLYFQTFSGKEIPLELDRPVHRLDELKKMKVNLKHHN